MSHFDIKYVDYNTGLDKVEGAVLEELNGPGQLLGYRAMHKKLREQHQLPVPRGLVYDVMTKVDPEGFQRRGNVGENKTQARSHWDIDITSKTIRISNSTHNLYHIILLIFDNRKHNMDAEK